MSIRQDSPDCNLTQTSLNIKGIFGLGSWKALGLGDNQKHNLSISLIYVRPDLRT